SANEPLQSWINSQTQFSKHRILSNIAPFADDPSALPGAVCASPSRHHPDYYYAWTRDSALVMNEMFSWLLLNQTMGDTVQQRIDDYVGFTRHLQSLPGLRYGLGEAKFHMDGSAFTGSWCNAQTDGPAIRAYMLTKYAGYLRDRGHPVDYLYSSQAKSVIKTDLEYITEMWQDTRSCDIWEETRGAHFYTRMAQWRALLDGSELARSLGDTKGYIKYRGQARALERDLGRFWDARRGHLLTTLDWSGGLASKQSNLDTQVLLAALHFGNTDSKYSVASVQMMATVSRLVEAFGSLYPINSVVSTDISGISVPIGVAIGRYPEDVYNGDGTSMGNPWSLATSAMAEYHYRLGVAFTAMQRVPATHELAEILNLPVSGP
ncbi:hypothetical protein EC988_007604, partial [Linderina pennispora]